MMHGSRMSSRWLVALAVSCLLAGSAAAVAGDGELGVQMGFVFPDEPLTGVSRDINENDLVFGVRGSYLFSSHVGWFLDGLFGNIETSPLLPADAETWSARTGFDFYFSPHYGDHAWFASLGGGLADFDIENVSSFERTFGSLSLGHRWALGDANLRLELRADRTIDDDGLGGQSLTNGYLLLGLSWGVGAPPEDSDGDGVSDRKDACPDTPRGAIVDEKGCPIDTDGDGVPDGIDKCPDTPQGWPVDETGCPLDSDGDGVPDGRDDCANTPAGAEVDERGCPIDSDGDGVPNGIDNCPDTPEGARVDAAGCPSDSDGDGVLDGIDKCPDTPEGARVDATGCPSDGDGDGVLDGIDKCPDTPKGTPVDESGCAKAAPLFEEGRKTLVLEGVNFEFNSDELTAASRTVLDRVADSLLAWPEIRVEIGGHSDSIGGEEYNMRLSDRRAESVMGYLAGKGVADDRMTARGYGESRPIADNTTDAGRAKNRRVELTRLD